MVKIGLTLSIERRGALTEYVIPSDYVAAVIDCGAFPLLIPPLEGRRELDEYISSVDGIIMTGGDDISPEIYGEENMGLSLNTSRTRDDAEMYILDRALDLEYPILGICRGFQLINVYFEGTLFQDLETQFGVGVIHRNLFREPGDLHHEVIIEEGTALSGIIGCSEFMVNSRHHQGVKSAGKGLFPSAFSGDGIIEAVEQKDMNIIAVQWHPENLVRLGGRYRALFEDLIKRCELFKGKK